MLIKYTFLCACRFFFFFICLLILFMLGFFFFLVPCVNILKLCSQIYNSFIFMASGFYIGAEWLFSKIIKINCFLVLL